MYAEGAFVCKVGEKVLLLARQAIVIQYFTIHS